MGERPALRLAGNPEEADSIPGVRSSVRLARAAAALDCDPSHIRLLIAQGKLEGHRIGKRGIRVYSDSLAAYQAGHPIAASPAGRQQHKAQRRRAGAPHRAAVANLRALGIL